MNYEYCDGITHTIKQGETLYSLSRFYKVPLAILLRANPYIDVYNLKVGDTICVPVKNARNKVSMEIDVDENMSGVVSARIDDNINSGCKNENENDNDNDDDNNDDERRWIKYVAQSGDTLQDILDRSDCSKEMFWDKNSPDRMYMLPGVAYFILEND